MFGNRESRHINSKYLMSPPRTRHFPHEKQAKGESHSYAALLGFVFDVLQNMSFGAGTKRSIVHDLQRRKIYFIIEGPQEKATLSHSLSLAHCGL